jgi:hypothetical protein
MRDVSHLPETYYWIYYLPGLQELVAVMEDLNSMD